MSCKNIFEAGSVLCDLLGLIFIALAIFRFAVGDWPSGVPTLGVGLGFLFIGWLAWRWR